MVQYLLEYERDVMSIIYNGIYKPTKYNKLFLGCRLLHTIVVREGMAVTNKTCDTIGYIYIYVMRLMNRVLFFFCQPSVMNGIGISRMSVVFVLFVFQ